MSATQPIQFRKMNGLGNDFVVFDAREGPVRLSNSAAANIADRQTGIGCDQVIVIEPSETSDAFMRIFNADGSEVEACGNATRCVAWLLAGDLDRTSVSIDTTGGKLSARVQSQQNVTVDMGRPKFGWEQIPLAEEFRDTRGIELQIGPVDAPILHTPAVVNVGNPHAVFWVDDVNAHDLARFGPLLENHPIFPDRANISLAQIISADSLRLRTWERGVGLTKACGTAACAAAACAARKKLTNRKVRVELPGGELMIEWSDDDRILMTGPVELENEGSLEPSELA